MSVLGWTLICVAWALGAIAFLRWLRWNVALPLPGRMQDVRSIAWRARQWDVEDAVERALESARFETAAGSDGSR